MKLLLLLSLISQTFAVDSTNGDDCQKSLGYGGRSCLSDAGYVGRTGGTCCQPGSRYNYCRF